MSQVRCEAIAASALRDWLLLQLPAKVTEVNADRAAVLKTPWAGPYVIPAGGTLGIGVTSGTEAVVSVALTTGTRTATQLAADINGTGGLSGVASVDSANRLVLTSPSSPSTTAPSVVKLRGNGTTDVNGVLGWDKGGEKAIVAALIAPASRGIIDGWPRPFDLGPQAAIGSPVCLIIGDRDSAPVTPANRRDEYVVTLDLTVLRPDSLQQSPRTREPITSALRCVRECLLQDAGRYLGRASVGDIQNVTEKRGRVAGIALPLGGAKALNPLFDVAVMLLEVRVFERPGAT